MRLLLMTTCAAALVLTGCPEDEVPTVDVPQNEVGTPDADATGSEVLTETVDETTQETAEETIDEVVDDVPPLVVTCETYCNTVAAACTGDNAQYTNEAECLSVCNDWVGWDAGTSGDQAGNTIACRLYHATAATGPDAGAEALHCPHAGPTGGNVCGTYCENYCELAARNCTGGDALYASDLECNAACAAFRSDGPVGAPDGGSVQCRLYHLQVAGSDPPDSTTLHCPHGGEDGGGVCVDEPPNCDDYCKDITAACTGNNAQYASEAACLSYCKSEAALPIGEFGDTAGNTVGCRMYHTGVASQSDENAQIHCDHAGPSGGNICGTWCTNYCHLEEKNCTGDNDLFANVDDCTIQCATINDENAFAGDTDGDSVQCRIYHLGVAGLTSPEVHCPHGDLDGGGVCVEKDPTCDEYCTKITANCTGDNEQYASKAACMSYCESEAQIPLGTAADQAGNTVGCRIYHAEVAGNADADIHCDHAGPSGGDVCGGWCTVYCDLAGKNCTGDNELYTNSDTCAVACNAFAEDGEAGDTAGDSVQCRIYHLGVAGASGPETHCPHGGVDGGGVCVDEAKPDPTCAEYCTAVTANCTGDNLQYADEQACLDYCNTAGAFPIGTADDTAGNTVGCRTYHAGVAGGGPADAAIHCDHAGPSGGNVCGTWCENYCDLSAKNCTGANAISFAADCATDCAGYEPGGEAGDTDTDSVQCRIYHLGVAGSTAPELHCTHGAPDGGGVCIVPVGGPVAPTYDDDVQPIFQSYCSGCHTGASETGCSGQRCFGSFYSATQLDSLVCSGKTTGECAHERAEDGSMPLGGGPSPTPAELDTVQEWIDAGMPEN